MRQLELGWDTNSDRERNAMVTPRHLALASWGERGLGTTHSNSIKAVTRKPKSASRTGDPPPRISDFPLSGGAMLAEKTKRGRGADVTSCREEIGFGLRMGDGSPFRIISLSLCSTPFNAK